MRIETVLFLATLMAVGESECGDDNCLICANGAQCDVPLRGYFLDEDNKSLKCFVSSCLECYLHQGQPRCTKCIDGHYPKQFFCVPCDNDRCKTCNPNNPMNCESCNDGKYLNNGDCIDCPQQSPLLVCFQCSNSICSECPPTVIEGYTIDHQECIKCQDLYCLQCPNNYQICEKCALYHGVEASGSSRICTTCSDPNCKNCTQSISTCHSCNQGYTLENSSCVPCDPHCQECGQGDCVYCVEGYRLHYSGQCQMCQDVNCALCQTDKNICTFCKIGYGLTPTNICQECAFGCQCSSTNVSHCHRCLQTTNKFHIPSDGVCAKNCHYLECVICSQDYFQCQICKEGFGVNNTEPSFHHCDECQDLECLNCSMNFTKCLECNLTFGVNQTECIPCNQHIKCLNCSFNYNYCHQCIQGYQLYNGKCIQCNVDNCTSCSSNNFCYQCQQGYYNDTDGKCAQCPQRCSKCHSRFYDDVGVTCTQCFQYFQVDNGECKDICGDLFVIDLPCEHQFGIKLDGCEDNCEIEKGFNCTKAQPNTSVCSYVQDVQLSFVGFHQTKSINKYILVVEVFPPLYVFTLMDGQQILDSFRLGNNQFQIVKANYNKTNNRFSFDVMITSKARSNAFVLNFQPKEETRGQFFQTPNVTALMSYDFTHTYYFSNSAVIMIKITEYLCYIIVVLAWISVLFGVILEETYGLEAMFVVQFAFITMLWLDTPFLVIYYFFLPLKYSFGYNYGHFVEQSVKQTTKVIPFTSQFEISNQFFINNFSFLFILMSLSAFCSFVLCVLYKLKKSKNRMKKKQTQIQMTNLTENKQKLKYQLMKKQLQEKQLEKQNKIIEDKYSSWYSFFLNILFHCISVSIIPLICFSVILFKSTSIQSIPNLLILTLSFIYTLLSSSSLYLFPYRYPTLLSPYILTRLSLFTPTLQTLLPLPYTLLLCIVPELVYLNFGVMGMAIIFMIVVHPHVEKKGNIRSIFNFAVICILIGFKYYAQKLPTPSLSENSTVIFIFIAILLVFVSIIISFIFHIIVFLQKIRQKQKLAKLDSREKKFRGEVLGNLVGCEMHEKVGKLRDRFFKDLFDHESSIKKISIKLRQAKMGVNQGNVQGRKGDHKDKGPGDSTNIKEGLGLMKLKEQKVKIDRVFDFDSLEWNKVDAQALADPQKQEDISSEINDIKQKIQMTQKVIENEYRYIQFKGDKNEKKYLAIKDKFLQHYNEIQEKQI